MPKFMFRTCCDGCGPQWWPKIWRPKFFEAACIEHDKNYRNSLFTQKDADDLFLQQMLGMAGDDRERRAEAGMMFSAVARYGHKFKD